MSKKRKKKKGTLRVDRIIMVLMIFGIIITSLNLIPYIIYNNKIYILSKNSIYSRGGYFCL